jgi:sigma-B regulation protein RsbU (phosphoserine phosphatase)
MQPVRWRIRTKLLCMLLGITVLPLVFVTWIDFKSLRRLGQDLATFVHAELLLNSRTQLGLTADNYAMLIQRQNEMLETLLAWQAREVETRINAPPVDTATPVILDSDIDGNAPAISGLARLAERHSGDSEAGTSVQAAYDAQAFRLPIGSDVAQFTTGLNQLASLDAVYRSLYHNHADLILWQYTSLETGLHSVYPAHGGYPQDYEPRQRPWYREQKRRNALTWHPAQIDASTRQAILTLSMPVHDNNGEFAGVTAIDIPVAAYLTTLPLPADWNAQGAIFIVTPEINADEKSATPSPGPLRILARQHYKAQEKDWQKEFAAEYLHPDAPQADAQLHADVAQQRNGFVESTHDGQNALWAYRRIGNTANWLVIIVPHASAEAAAAMARDKALAQTHVQLRDVLALGLPLIALAVAGALFSARAINRPLQDLVHAARQISAGDFEVRTHIATGDELEMLGHAFNHMVPHLKERFRHAEGLRLAREVQQNLIPATPPARRGIDLAGVTLYCEETGGDYYDFLEIGKGEQDPLGIAIGDVSGHGVSSALLMATARALLHAFAPQSRTLAELICAVNERLADDVHQGRFMTMFYLLVNPANATLRWISAGHDPALMYRAADASLTELSGDDIPLGVDSDWLYREANAAKAAAGDVVLLGTDGVWDARNAGGEAFGKTRLRDLLQQNHRLSATEICSSVTDAVRDFRGTSAQKDDMTVVVLRFE